MGPHQPGLSANATVIAGIEEPRDFNGHVSVDFTSAYAGSGSSISLSVLKVGHRQELLAVKAWES
jgi:hypothetical protein